MPGVREQNWLPTRGHSHGGASEAWRPSGLLRSHHQSCQTSKEVPHLRAIVRLLGFTTLSLSNHVCVSNTISHQYFFPLCYFFLFDSVWKLLGVHSYSLVLDGKLSARDELLVVMSKMSCGERSINCHVIIVIFCLFCSFFTLPSDQQCLLNLGAFSSDVCSSFLSLLSCMSHCWVMTGLLSCNSPARKCLRDFIFALCSFCSFHPSLLQTLLGSPQFLSPLLVCLLWWLTCTMLLYELI